MKENAFMRQKLIVRAVCLALALPGCVTGVPARRLPPDLLAKPRANKDTIDYVRLRQDPPVAGDQRRRAVVAGRFKTKDDSHFVSGPLPEAAAMH